LLLFPDIKISCDTKGPAIFRLFLSTSTRYASILIAGVLVVGNVSAAPNLTLNQPSGWSDKIVVSKTTGTTTDSNPLLPTDNLYVDFSVINNGSNAATVSFATRLYVDGNLRTTATTNPPLNPGVDTRLIDFPIGTLSAGAHTIRVVIDSGNSIAESNEGDNDFTKTITVSNPTPTPGQPNLTLNQPSGWSDKIVVSKATGTTTDSSPLLPTDTLYVDFSVINNGSSAATVSFATRLYVDGNLRTTATTNPPLNPGVDTRLIDFPIGTLSAGTHTIRVVIDSSNSIAESNEGDNDFTKTITVSNPTPTPGQPNLTLNQPSGWSDKIVVSKATGTNTDSSPLVTTDDLYVDFSIINNGSSAATAIVATQLYVDGNLRTTATTSPPLNPGVDTRLIDFPIGTLSAGTHSIRIVIDSGNAIIESNEGDNDFTKTITVSNLPPTPTPTPTATPTVPTPTPSPSATIAPPGQVTVSVHSAPSKAIANPNSPEIDSVLILKPYESLLAGAQTALFKGLVADGVTPLIVQINSTNFSTQPYTYEISLNVTGGSLITGPLSNYLRVLSNGSFISDNKVTISSGHPTAFAYISGIRAEDVRFSSGNKELMVQLSIGRPGFTLVDTKQFFIRKPPIILVHGYKSSNDTWYNDELQFAPNGFLTALQSVYPIDFAVPVEYGVIRDRGKVTKTGLDGNAYGTLTFLATELDRALKLQEETFRQSWALTRYDVAAHSQGGVLARMLCTNNKPYTATPFRSGSNANRGRFRRIVTIGSPHNGSTFAYYLQRLSERITYYNSVGAIPYDLTVLGLLQEKFDPFGSQMLGANGSEWTVDPAAKFHLITTTIDGGASPPLQRLTGVFSEPLAYTATGLCGSNNLFANVSRGSVVLPFGSDGVVDLKSQFAGGGTPTTNVSANLGVDIAHASGPGGLLRFLSYQLFRVGDGVYDTQYSGVAQRVLELLSGDGTDFAPFVRTPLPANLQSEIDSVVPGIRLVDGLIQKTSSSNNTPPATSDNTSVFTYHLQAAAGSPIVDTPSWFAEVYGPDGVTTSGLTISQHADDPTYVDIAIADSVVGDVALFAQYGTGNTDLISAQPAIVMSRSPGSAITGIELVPGNTVLTAGGKISTQIWVLYDNGTRAQPYVAQADAVQYSSTNANVASVDASGIVTLRNPGVATIRASYLGFSAESQVSVITGSGLANISTRLPVGTGNNAMIGGFIVTGTQPKKVIIRGIGPSLNVPGKLSNPTLELYQANTLLESNDDWQQSGNKQGIIDSTIPPIHDLEAAIVATLPANNSTYTAILRGANNETGVGVVEAYDLDRSVDSKLANISTRGLVDIGDNVMIGGSIVTGSNPANVLFRAIGPSLANFGVGDTLQDPVLELHDGNGGTIAVNDNWRDAQEAAITATSIPPMDNRESAILAMLPPGAYTAVVRGKDDSIGVALVEAYQLQ
jgi:hypothetical protein